MNTGDFLQQIIDTHGGISLWNSIDAIEADISVQGFLLTAKHRPALTHIKVTAKAHEPHFIFHDFPSAGLAGELIGNDEVRITDSKGCILNRRRNPRSAFRGFRRMIYWDELDFIYFGGYATWNYLTAPFLFLWEGIQIEPCSDISLMLTGIKVSFPEELPVHCKTQSFYFDEKCFLRRFDYTAEVVGHWAQAAQFCENYREFSGLKVPTHRRVLPLFGRKNPLPVPTLVDIDIHNIRLKQICPAD